MRFQISMQNLVTCAAVAVAVVAVLRMEAVSLDAASSATAAEAAPPEPRFSASDQRQQIINELAELNGRMARLEAAVSRPLDVKVIELPKDSSK